MKVETTVKIIIGEVELKLTLAEVKALHRELSEFVTIGGQVPFPNTWNITYVPTDTPLRTPTHPHTPTGLGNSPDTSTCL